MFISRPVLAKSVKRLNLFFASSVQWAVFLLREKPKAKKSDGSVLFFSVKDAKHFGYLITHQDRQRLNFQSPTSKYLSVTCPHSNLYSHHIYESTSTFYILD